MLNRSKPLVAAFVAALIANLAGVLLFSSRSLKVTRALLQFTLPSDYLFMYRCVFGFLPGRQSRWAIHTKALSS